MVKPSTGPWRFGTPVLLLLLGIGVMAAAAFQAHQAVRSQRATVEEALRDYAVVTAWSLGHHLESELGDAVWEHLQAVNHGEGVHSSPSIPPAHDLGHYLDWDSAGCLCHRPDHPVEAYFGFTLGSDTIQVAPNLYAGPGLGVVVDREFQLFREAEGHPAREPRAYPTSELRWLQEALTESARNDYSQDWRFAFVTGEVAGRSLVTAYTVMPTSWGDTVLYALELAPVALAALADGVLDDQDILPPAFTRELGARGILDARLSDAEGRLLWATEGSAPADSARLHRTTRPLPPQFGEMALTASIRPEAVGSLLIGGVPRSRLPILLAMLALATALALFAFGQMRRESRLASERAAFVSSVSHELRTPLAQMRLYLDTLRLGRATSEQAVHKSLGLIDRETTRLANLVDNVLRFSRPESDVARAASTLDLSSEARDAVRGFGPLAEARRVRIVEEIEPDLAVRADRDGVRQIAINFLDNAVKYGPPEQSVTVRVRAAGAGRARLEVEDEGPGVPEDERDAIWLAFRRGDGPSAAAVGGSGIGLSVVRDIAERCGGATWVEEAAGGGALFVAEFDRA
ncbi:MAG: HAMP domain-containing sensor histidine kinase [Gemmatimonadota bacterium]